MTDDSIPRNRPSTTSTDSSSESGEFDTSIAPSQKIQDLERRVMSYLQRLGLRVERSEDGIYLFKYGSTVVMVSLFEYDQNTYVRFASTLLKDFERSYELMEEMLRLNNEVLLGAFLLFDDDTISFAVTLLGDFLDFAELELALKYVAKVSDDYDDVFQRLAGGKKASDILREESEI